MVKYHANDSSNINLFYAASPILDDNATFEDARFQRPPMQTETILRS